MEERMIGRQFDRLTVVREVRKDGAKKRYWLCRCVCGNEKVVEESHLKSGHTRSCGCYRRDLLRGKAIDLTGERYGRLVVLGPEKDADGSVRGWRCRCDCGRISVFQKGNLRAGATKSCGCLQREQRKKNMRQAIHFVDGTCVEKIASKKISARNTTGHRGVYRRKPDRWRASIGFQGKVYNLGTFESFEEAVQARLKAEEEFYGPFLKKYREGRGDAGAED